MHRYGFKTPAEIDAVWSRALCNVMAEAIFWNHYVPPQDGEATQHVNPLQALGIQVQTVS